MIDQWSEDRTGWAKFSDDMTMRYRLARSLDGRPLVYPRNASDERCVFVMLNPSTADAFILDPTIKRCVSFAAALGADVLEVVNIFAMRSTDPQALYKRTFASRGDDQTASEEIMDACVGAVRVIAGWGKHGALDFRGDVVRSILRHAGVKLYHLGLNRDGSPKHPLYLKGGTEPQEWTSGPMAETKPRPAHRLTDSQIAQLTDTLYSISPGQLAALTSVRDAARRGASVAMLPGARERLELGMAALESIIAATGGRR